MKRIPVASEAKKLFLPSLAIFLISLLAGLKLLSIFSLTFFAFVLYFFRDPKRKTDLDERFILSPADGRVLKVERGSYGDFGSEKCFIVSIFMSLFDVHVNRSPTDAEVIALRYERGSYRSAFKKGVERTNERNYVLMRKGNEKILLVQIAGFIARRIYCYVREGQRVKRGERIGMIAFGSRVDVFIPETYELLVQRGQKMKAGITPIAKKRGENGKKEG